MKVGKDYQGVLRRDDGSLRLNFKPMPKLGADLSVDNYAFEVYRELRQALIGLVEEEWVSSILFQFQLFQLKIEGQTSLL